MSKNIACAAFFAILTLELFPQRPIMELTFTAVDSAAYVQLDSIKVMNRTHGGDTVLYWPDSVLSFNYVGMLEKSNEKHTFEVLQNFPNPVAGRTKVSLYVPEKDKVSITVTDNQGRMVVESEKVLDKGKHSFQFSPSNGNLYFFTARWQEQTSSIKILNLFSGNNICLLDYIGSEQTDYPKVLAKKDILDFSFYPGDELLCIGYTYGLQSGIYISPEESATYTFQFATNMPCPGTPTVIYEGQTYNTIQIFSQCWLKENLNVGEMIMGNEEMSDNDTLEKYCYNNESDSCTKYGGLYQWNEMMQYTTQQRAQGICPPGWHVPSDEEWKVLEGAVDSHYGIGDSIWDVSYWELRGYDAGSNLKTTSGWYENGYGTDLFGFSGLPGGFRYFDGDFVNLGYNGYWRTTTEDGLYFAWYRYLNYLYGLIGRSSNHKELGLGVRCLRDN